MTEQLQKLVQLCETYDETNINLALGIASMSEEGSRPLYNHYGFNPDFLAKKAYNDFADWLTNPTVRYVGGFNPNVFNRKNIATLSLRRVTLDATLAKALEGTKSKRIAKINLRKCEIAYVEYCELWGAIMSQGSKDYIGLKLTRTLIRDISGTEAYNSHFVTSYLKFSYAGVKNFNA